jgi:uncharacterized membrane protein
MTQQASTARLPGRPPAADQTGPAQLRPEPGPPQDPAKSSKLRTAARVALGLALAGFGVAHLTFAREPFHAQVPDLLAQTLPVSRDDIVLGSGIIEIGLGAALVALPKERRRVGVAAAAYFVAIFPGNISQLLRHEDAFGLDTDRKRAVRLGFQPLLVLWSLFGGGVI